MELARRRQPRELKTIPTLQEESKRLDRNFLRLPEVSFRRGPATPSRKLLSTGKHARVPAAAGGGGSASLQRHPTGDRSGGWEGRSPQGLSDSNRLSNEFRHWEEKENGLQSRLNRSSLFNSGVPGVLREAIPYPRRCLCGRRSLQTEGETEAETRHKEAENTGHLLRCSSATLFPRSSLGRGSKNAWPVPARGGPGESPRSLLRGGKAPASSPWPGGSVPVSRRPRDWLPVAAEVQLSSSRAQPHSL